MIKMTIKIDSSSCSKNKPYYIVNEEKMSENMTHKQICFFVDNLLKLGVSVENINLI